MRVCLWGRTFDMSGGPKGAKRPLARPIDGGVGVIACARDPYAASACSFMPSALANTIQCVGKALALHQVRIPVNVTADSGIVTGIPVNVTGVGVARF